MDTITLGATGLRVSRLCIGTGTNGWNGSSQQSRLGIRGLARLLRHACDRGITFWDSADAYGTHPHVGEALAGLDRSTVTVTTKTLARTREEAERDVRRFLREMRTNYLDIVLLHCLTDPNWPARFAGAMEALSRAKEEGLVRAVGVSCHDFGAFSTAAATPWVEVVLARLNYANRHMDAVPERVIPVLGRMHAAGKGIYGMKVMGAGGLGHDPREAIHFVLDQPCVDALVVGMVNEREVDENAGLVEEWEGALVPA